MTVRPLKGISLLIADDDALGGFRMRQRLVRSGAWVATAGAREAIAYLGSPQLAAVLVGTLLAGSEAAAFVAALRACKAPWVVYDVACGAAAVGAACAVDPAAPGMLEATLGSLCAPRRQ